MAIERTARPARDPAKQSLQPARHLAEASLAFGGEVSVVSEGGHRLGAYQPLSRQIQE